MSVSTLPALSHADLPFAHSAPIPQRDVRHARPAYVRRRGSSEQGRALETLGHAVEYLVDSRLRFNDSQAAAGEREAIEILMRLNRAVFSECPEVVPFSRRVRQWIFARASRVQKS